MELPRRQRNPVVLTSTRPTRPQLTPSDESQIPSSGSSLTATPARDFWRPGFAYLHSHIAGVDSPRRRHSGDQQYAFRGPAGRGAGLKTGGPSRRRCYQIGGGGGNRTRVRKPSATTSTCISGLWTGTRARRRLSLFRSRTASTRRIAARNLSLVLTDGSGRPPAKPA